MRKFFFLFLLSVFCVGVGRLWYWTTDGFRLSRIEGFDEPLPNKDLSEEAKTALSQSYSYLGRGRQCFAFQSEDGKYVIKFIRTDRYRDRFFPYFNQRRKESRVTRKERLLSSLEISFEELREDTAIIAMSGVSERDHEVKIIDRLGRPFLLPLEKAQFILQRKVRLFKDVFQEALLKKDRAEMAKILDQMLEVVVRIARKGIISKDGAFLKNFGFDQTRAYQIDIGSFYRKASFNTAIHASVENLRIWLSHLDPALLELLDQKLGLIYENE